MKRFLTTVIILSAVLLISGGQASALSVSGTMNVSVTITENCQVDTAATAMNFGTYQSAAGANLDANTLFNIKCPSGAAYSIDLNDGQHYNSGRNLYDGAANFAKYDLYKDNGYSTRWGTGASGLSGQLGTGTSQPFTVYGRLFGSQSVPAGSYSDTVTITVNY